MQEAIVQVILESLEHSVWLCLSLSSIVHITCSLFVITLLSRFSRKTVSCSFLRTRTAWSSRARLSRANDGITGSCSSKPFTDATIRRSATTKKFGSNDFIYSLDFHDYEFVTILSYREIIDFFFSASLLPDLRRKKEAASERASARSLDRA